MLQNAYSLAKIGANAAENEQHSAEILPIGRRVLREILVDAGTGQVSLQTSGRNSVQGRSAASRRKDRKEGVRRLVKVRVSKIGKISKI